MVGKNLDRVEPLPPGALFRRSKNSFADGRHLEGSTREARNMPPRQATPSHAAMQEPEQGGVLGQPPDILMPGQPLAVPPELPVLSCV